MTSLQNSLFLTKKFTIYYTQPSMRKRTYFITLFAYMTVHILRMSLPFVQLDIQQFYNVDNFFMGVVQACAYISIGMGYLYLLFFPIENILSRYLLNMGLAALAYFIIVLFFFFDVSWDGILIICLIIAGFAQAAAYPVVIKLIYQHYQSKKDGLLLGFWASSGDMGNIVSFLIDTLIFYVLKWPWYICLLFASVVTITMAIIMKTCLVDTHETLDEQKTYTYTTDQILYHLKKFFTNVEYVLLFTVICLLKGTLYGILLWLPMYFQQAGFKQFEGYIPMTFSFFTIVGSAVFGSLYSCVFERFKRSFITIIVMILLVIGLFTLKTLELKEQQKYSYLVLIGGIGFCLGGTFNSLISIQSSIVGREAGIQVEFIGTIMMTGSCTVVGIVQLIIGISTSQNEDSIFILFLIFGLVSLGLLIIRTIILCCFRNEQIQNERWIEMPKGDQ